MSNHTKVLLLLIVVGGYAVIALMLLSNRVPAADVAEASTPEPGSLEKGAIIMTMHPWTGITVVNRKPIRGADGAVFEERGSCWASKDTRLEVLGTDDSWVLFALKEQGKTPNPYGKRNDCPVGTLFFTNALVAEEYARYTVQYVAAHEAESERAKKVESLIEEYDRQHR